MLPKFSAELVPTVSEIRGVLGDGSEFVQPVRYRWQFGRQVSGARRNLQDRLERCVFKAATSMGARQERARRLELQRAVARSGRKYGVPAEVSVLHDENSDRLSITASLCSACIGSRQLCSSVLAEVALDQSCLFGD